MKKEPAETAIIACSSLKEYVEYAQKKVGTDHPVYYLDRKYHRDPNEMREHVIETIRSLPAGMNTVLVAMGFCGGSWDGVSAPCRIVLPRVDDCVSLLLQTGDEPKSNLKMPKHLYVRALDPGTESFKAIFDRLTADKDESTKRRYHEDWKRYYDYISIIDTGINGCRSEDYFNTVKKDADWLDAAAEYVPGGAHLIEKLLRGEWDGQFVVLEPHHAVSRADMLIGG